jgi:glyoxylase-like metal-dependent hydrolase (beta-lactamase superfamily II)
MQIVSGIHRIPIPIPDNPLQNINCYLIKGSDGWWMIDPGWYTVDAFNVLLKGLIELGLTPKDISSIIVTHIHPDHFGLAGRIKQVSPQTRLLMHQWEACMIESRYAKVTALKDKMTLMLHSHGVPAVDSTALESAYLPDLDSFVLAVPDFLLYGGEIIRTGIFDLEVIWTPGHSPGHICLYEPENGLLFSGDHILPSITPNVSFNIQSCDNPLGHYLYALNKLRNLPVTKVLPGHESPFINLPERIKQILRHHDQRKAEVQLAISNEPHNAWEISSQISWDTPVAWEDLPPLHMRSAVTETIAHLELLRSEGKVCRIYQGTSISYMINK